jgi:alginate O-acetyltransferase complex protein AlgJ
MAKDNPQPGAPDQPVEATDTTMGGHKAPEELSREEQAKIELGRTEISRPLSVSLVLALLFTILSVQVWQHVHDVRQNLRVWHRTAPEQRHWTQLLPHFYEIVELKPDWSEVYEAKTWWGYHAIFPTVSEINLFESTVEENSVLAENAIPHVQQILTRYGGTGNEKAVTGVDKWLFYRPGMTYITAVPFLLENRLRDIARHTDAQPDPIKAILDFQRQLAERDIELIVVPTPVKPQIYPERVTRRYDTEDGPFSNPSYGEFVGALHDAGVSVVDPVPKLADMKKDGHAVYLSTDTHWTPRAVELIARAIARQVRQVANLRETDQSDAFYREKRRVTSLGDVATMLNLPETQRLYEPETVTLNQVKTGDDAPWHPRRDAEVLLLGDSFTNIYSVQKLGWGQHGGLAEELSYALQQPVDRIAINAGGAYSAREALVKDLRTHYKVFNRTGNPPERERLADKKVVVYQFACRELLHGNWKLLEMPDARPEAFGDVAQREPVAEKDVVRVHARIADIARPPRPGSAPYEDAIVALHLTDIEVVSGKADELGDELLVFSFGMRDKKWTRVARFSSGKKRTFELRPWRDVKARYGSIQKIDLGTDADFLYPVWWSDIGGDGEAE